MPGAVIAFDQTRPGPVTSYGSPGVARNDLWLSCLITCRSTQSGNTSYQWTLLNAPTGSAAVLANATTADATFTPDLAGSYRLQLVTNGGGAGNVQILIAAVRYDATGALLMRGWRIPAVGEQASEDNFNGQTRGWSEAYEFMFADILANIGGGGGSGVDAVIMASGGSINAAPGSSGNTLVSLTNVTATGAVTLPASPATGIRVVVSISDGSSFGVTVSGNGKTIGSSAASSISVTGAGAYKIFEYDGTQWSIIGASGTSAVTSVTGTAPIVSSGGLTPVISISPATDSTPGSMSAADKAKLDGLSGSSSTTCGMYSARPAPGNAGHRHTTLDGSVEFVDDGTVWRPVILGCLGTEVAPGNSISAFTQVGTTPSLVDVTGGVLSFHHTVNGGNTLGGYEKPKTTGQALTAHIIPQIFPTGSNSDIELCPVGVWVRDTNTGKVEGIFFGDTGLQNGLPTLNIYTYTNLTTFAGNPVGGSVMTLSHGIWFRILDTGTTLVFQFSYNGRLWDTLYTDSTNLGSQGTVYGVGADPVHQAITTIVDSFGIA